MPHFIKTTTCLCVGESSGANICWKIIHTRSADTGDFARFTKYVYFLRGVCGRFNNDADLGGAFTRIIRDTVFHRARVSTKISRENNFT